MSTIHRSCLGRQNKQGHECDQLASSQQDMGPLRVILSTLEKLAKALRVSMAKLVE